MCKCWTGLSFCNQAACQLLLQASVHHLVHLGAALSAKIIKLTFASWLPF